MSLTKCRNIQSLSVETDSTQIRKRTRNWIHPLEVGHSHSDKGVKYLTDSLATLENLKTLTLDLHYCEEIVSQTLGPSGILSLAGLPNLQTLAVPFHFFIRLELDNYHKVVSPAIVLPRTLKTLKIVACYKCISVWIGSLFPVVPSAYQHVEAVLEFLEGLSNLHAELFPGLKNICYEEDRRDYRIHDCERGGCTSHCGHPFRFFANSDMLRLEAISGPLRRNGITLKFEQRTREPSCKSWMW